MNEQNGGNNKNEMEKKLIGAESTNLMEKLQKCSIQRRGLPAELLNELFAALPLENAFGILARMPNGLLARNVQKMLKSVEMAIKGNKWNEADCGPKLAISEGGLVVKHLGPNGFNSIRAISPIPSFKLSGKKPTIAAYFELEIVCKNSGWNNICIGFCTKEFPLEGGEWLGTEENSIGTYGNIGMWINGEFKRFENSHGGFRVGNVIGVGLIHSTGNSSMKCFATWNGQLLGTFKLPNKFARLQLFSAVTLETNGDSIRANFGLEKWHFINPIQICNIAEDAEKSLNKNE